MVRIISTYMTVAFIISNIVRGYFTGIFSTIMYDDLPIADRVLQVRFSLIYERALYRLASNVQHGDNSFICEACQTTQHGHHLQCRMADSSSEIHVSVFSYFGWVVSWIFNIDSPCLMLPPTLKLPVESNRLSVLCHP
jgi:hypothetical protein